MNKSIILIIPYHFEIYKGVIKNLKTLGFEVELLFVSDTNFVYKSFYQKLTNFFRKNFLFDKNYKQQLRDDYHNENLSSLLNKITKKTDYALVIRPDFFSQSTLQLLKTKTKKMVAYQWDGFKRFPTIVNYINLFDSFFVFDIDDLEKYGKDFPQLKPVTNFYLDFEKEQEETASQNQVYFVGSYLENRIDAIVNIAKYLQRINIKSNINIKYFKKQTPSKYPDSNINFITTDSSYLDMIEDVKKATIVLDFANSFHNGLSTRVFEAIYFKKKLITNNPIVKKYDFYNPNNIFIWDEKNEHELENFISLPQKEIDEKIIQKYSFSNWINYVLDIEPYQKIRLHDYRKNDVVRK